MKTGPALWGLVRLGARAVDDSRWRLPWGKLRWNRLVLEGGMIRGRVGLRGLVACVPDPGAAADGGPSSRLLSGAASATLVAETREPARKGRRDSVTSRAATSQGEDSLRRRPGGAVARELAGELVSFPVEIMSRSERCRHGPTKEPTARFPIVLETSNGRGRGFRVRRQPRQGQAGTSPG